MNRLRRLGSLLSPAARLATAYVAIIMVISISFSAALYHLSADQLSESLHHQYLRYRPFFYSRLLTPPGQPVPMHLQDELDSGTGHLEIELVYFNLVILLLASSASYLLAKRTLRPIEDALEAQSRFTADASHELRTPLTAMQTEIEVALRDPKLTEAQAKKLLASNLEEVAKLRALSDGLLRLAREDGNGLVAIPVSLVNVADLAVDRVKRAAHAGRITIDNGATAVTALGDEQSLTDLVVILLDNAIKYSSPESTVQISTKHHGQQAILAVTDHGAGIAAAELPHIFERFYRADPSRSKDQVEGYGLGLSIARKIAQLHHGTIEVSSTAGKGSTFTVKLPLPPT